MSEQKPFGGGQADPVVPKKLVEEALVAMLQDADFDFIDASELDEAEPAVSPDGEIANQRGNKWEARKRTIEIELDGRKIPLELESYDFEYPERIQKETGIFGYERTKISSQSVMDFIKKYYLIKYDINLEDYGYGFESVESIKEFKEKHEERRKSRLTENGVYTHEYCYSRQFAIDELLSNIQYQPIKEMLRLISNDEYPTKCFNHVFSAYVGNEEQKIAYHDEFKRSKLFIQKIYSPESRKRLGENVFRHKGVAGQYSTNEIFKKSDGTIVPKPYGGYNADRVNLERDNNWEFTELNCTTSDFWDKSNGLSFGFSMGDSFLKEYMEKSLQCIKDIKNDDRNSRSMLTRVSHDGLGIVNGTVSVIWVLVHFNKKIQKFLFENMEECETGVSIIRETVDEAFSEIEKQTSFPVAEFLGRIKEPPNEYPLEEINEHLDIKYENNYFNFFKASFIQKILGTRQKVLLNTHSNDAFIYNETHIPIFINHDVLPQLSWGHAKYSHYMNEQGLNFFKFRHAEHLSAPERAEQAG